MYPSQSAFQVYQRIERQEKVEIIDVREDHEWLRTHIKQAN